MFKLHVYKLNFSPPDCSCSLPLQVFWVAQDTDISVPIVATAAAMRLRLREADEPPRNNLYMHSKCPKDTRPWIRGYHWYKKKLFLQQSWGICYPKSFSVSLAAATLCQVPEELLHEHFHHLSVPAVSWKQIPSGPEATPPSPLSVSVRKDTIFGDTLLTLLFAACCSK